MISGVLVIDKTEGPTSHDIVAVARRQLGERRIGHCGTLDPLATGVLVLAVGQATRLVQFLSADDKTYEAAVRFGESTDTYDVTGHVTSTTAARPSREAVEVALAAFRGEVQQVPPAFSAKKRDGQRSYRLARRPEGPPPSLPPVTVRVDALTLTGFDGETASLAMRVSSGFYVRALVHDLGLALGTGAVMTALRRTASGGFGLEQAMPTSELATASQDALVAGLIPLGRLLPEVPALTLDAVATARARHGSDLPAPAAWLPDLPGLVRLVDEAGGLVGLAVPSARAGWLHPSTILGEA